ncbi:MAG TPA: two-component regulator propeller domain-containing protein, partial [Candidatus Polarisedimenticolaceae bacterium]|nr:two-component regulator propeller domain-containing protein [Candidatus Polarisedimenticolaceae bacterium]
MRLRAGCAVIALLTFFAVPADAGTRVYRKLDWRSGLPSSYTDQIEQDPDGFLWITTMAGSVRYDGTEAKLLSGPLSRFVPGSAATGRLLWMKADDAGRPGIVRLDGTPEPGPDGSPVLAQGARMTANGDLWTLFDGTLLHRSGTTWSRPMRPPGDDAFRTNPNLAADGSSVLVASRRSLYRVSADNVLTLVASIAGVMNAIEKEDGTVYAGSWLHDGGHVYEVREGRVRQIQRESPGRLMGMTLRGDVLWIAYDVGLVRVREGEPEDRIVDHGVGGPLFVDREGSLWVASAAGIFHLPEPETVSFNDIFQAYGRCLSRGRDGFWFSSWAGALHAVRSGPGWRFERRPEPHVNAVCEASDGTLWGTYPGAFTSWGPGRPHRTYNIGDTSIGDPCVTDAEDRLWFPTSDGLWALDRGAPQPRRIPGADGYVRAVTMDSEGSPWFARDESVCHVETGRVVCEVVDARASFVALRFMPSGDLWAASMGRGLYRRHAGRWEPVPGSASLGGAWILRIVPSPKGGVWIVGEGVVSRVEERRDLPEGFTVLERVGVWQGLPTAMVMDLIEDDDGTLWLATDMSLVKIPPAARLSKPLPPNVVPVEVSVDGKRLDADRDIELPYRRNRLDLRFAALSYREPALIRYRARIRPDEPWSGATSHPSFRFVDLAAGSYRVEVQASLDGVSWSESKHPVRVRVLLPWWRSGWFFLACGLGAAVALTVAYRIRIGQLLRLERQRTRIAMDLHDAIGSGLGSIRILAGLAERPTTPEGTRAQISARI